MYSKMRTNCAQGRHHGRRPPRAPDVVRRIKSVDDGRARARVHSRGSALGASGSYICRLIRLHGALPGQVVEFTKEPGAVFASPNPLQLRFVHVWMVSFNAFINLPLTLPNLLNTQQ